jgi:hypothetical protein
MRTGTTLAKMTFGSGEDDENCVAMAFYQIFEEMVCAEMIHTHSHSQNPELAAVTDDLADQFAFAGLNVGYLGSSLKDLGSNWRPP